ncbi:hypothetical protein ACIPWL_01125 [Streptomyces sp. NPDC090023]|uniref:hypothetical protein n=1 Tax=unclassified Streptomyces TaxID=2593676 RepID=UPI0037F75FD4
MTHLARPWMRVVLAFVLALLGSVLLAPGQPAYADTTHGRCPNYRIMDYVTKSWKLTHVGYKGNHSGEKQSYTIHEQVQTTLSASVTLTANASVKAKAAFLADAKVDTGISITGTGSKTRTTDYTLSVVLPPNHGWVFYHGRRYVQGVEYGYHCQSLENHIRIYTAKGHSFSAVNYEDSYRCDYRPQDGLAKLALEKGCP